MGNGLTQPRHKAHMIPQDEAKGTTPIMYPKLTSCRLLEWRQKGSTPSAKRAKEHKAHKLPLNTCIRTKEHTKLPLNTYDRTKSKTIKAQHNKPKGAPIAQMHTPPEHVRASKL